MIFPGGFRSAAEVFLRFVLICSVVSSAGAASSAQETRGTILGTVSDASGALVPGASVTITNVGTNVSTEAVTSEGGTFEVPFLQPGTYNVTITAQGFKRFTQQGVVVNIGSSANVEAQLETGAVSEEVVVTGATPLLETTSGSGAAVLDNLAVRSLPVFGGNAMLTVRALPGIQWTGQPNYLGLHSNLGSSAISAAGGAGGTEFVLDGIPNNGLNRRAAFLPHADAIEEVRVASSEFDARQGNTAGASINMVTKSGTNDFHGSLSYLHWQQRFNGTQTTTKSAYIQRIDQAVQNGNLALAEQLRNQPRQPSGRSHTYAFSIGGPVYLPRIGEGGPGLFSGKDKLFFFFAYNGYREGKSEEATAVNRTVPTEAHRRGDFSDLLTAFGASGQIYDPRTARLVGGAVVRDPFPNNQVPILNPIYNQIARLYPLPNAPGYINNYIASATPFDWKFAAYQNRIDANITQNQRLTGKWSWNDFLEDRGDYTYETARGLNSNGLVRQNFGVGLDYILTINPTTSLRLTAGYNRFIEGNIQNATQASFSPGSIGLPAYLDQRAGNFQALPFFDFSVYSDQSRTYPGFTRVSSATTAGELSKVLTNHTLRGGYDLRQNFRAAFNPGNSSGRFAFNNQFTRASDNASVGAPITVGLEWAAFMLGVPSTVQVSTNDTLYLTNPIAGFFFQDDWRASRKLTLNLGFRYEIEGGLRERYDRGIAQFDPTIDTPLDAAAEAAYRRNPIAQLSPDGFDVRGGTRYLGANGYPRTLNNRQPAYMPRVGFAYQLNDKTVVRGGYGLFYDVNNALNNGLDQFGYNRDTTTLLTSNNGLTFNNTNLSSAACISNAANCTTIFSDPFPALAAANGARFLDPLGNNLGSLARAGQGFSSIVRDWRRARQQRWRFGVQREVRRNTVVELAYLGSYTDNMGQIAGETDPVDSVFTQRLDVLPQQYWSTGLVRNTANAAFLNQNVPNPFNISNFAFLQTQNPVVYQNLTQLGFFTNANIPRHQLLRPYSLYPNLNLARVPQVSLKYHHAEASVTQRFSQGATFSASYQYASSQVRDFRANEFDPEPIYRQNPNYRPHSFRANGVFEAPFGKGRRFLSEGGFLGNVLGGWQIAPIYYLQSGRIISFPNLFFYGDDLRALKLSGDRRDRRNVFNWRLFPGAVRLFQQNRAAYIENLRQVVPASVMAQLGRTYETATPADFQPADFHVRVFSSRLNWLRSDIMSQIDLNISRRFSLSESARLEFRTDFINLLNSVQWNLPVTDPTNPDFGAAVEQFNTPRWIQFQLRLTF